MDGISIYKTRMRQGEALARKIRRLRPDLEIDVIIPIPDTSRIAAQSMAYELNIKFREGLMKNRYIGRTFIMPGQSQRKKSVRQKLNPVPLEFDGKDVMLVDDSIVRGTQLKENVQILFDYGAREVHMRPACPVLVYPCEFLNFSTSRSTLDLAGRKAIKEIEEIRLIRYVSRPFIFTASSSPSIIASAHWMARCAWSGWPTGALK